MMHGCRIANDALSPRDLICTFMTSEYDMNTLHNDTIPDGIKNAPSKCIDITNHYCTADAGCLPLRSFNIRIAGNSSTMEPCKYLLTIYLRWSRLPHRDFLLRARGG